MRLLAINQFYAPDESATAQLLADLCEDVAAEGYDVTVVTGRGGYLGGPSLPEREVKGGVQVLRAWSTSLGKASFAHRVVDYGSFFVSGIGRAASVVRPDVILALTTPPMIAAGAAVVAAARGVPLVAWVQDVYPEVAAAFGVMDPGSIVYRSFQMLARGTHQLTTRTVVLSHGMAERVWAQGAGHRQLTVIPNWADGQRVWPVDHANNEFRREHNLTNRFVVMYSGNLGLGHDVATLIDAARRIATTCPEVQFVFVGDGARLAEAKRLAVDLNNVLFLPHQPRDRLGESLSAADVHLVSLREELDGLLVPSKLYGVLASGRPVFYVGPSQCEVARVVRERGVGWEGRPKDGKALAEAVERAARNPGWHTSLCQRSRELFDECYDRHIAVARWKEMLLRVAKDPIL